LIGESNTGSCRTQTPFSTTASIADRAVGAHGALDLHVAGAARLRLRLADHAERQLRGRGARAERDARAAQERAAIHRLGEHARETAREARLRGGRAGSFSREQHDGPPQTFAVR